MMCEALNIIYVVSFGSVFDWVPACAGTTVLWISV
jgi:hypothetical protein